MQSQISPSPNFTSLQLVASEQGWQYGTVSSKFAYYVPRILNRTVPAYRTLVQFFEAYRTNVLCQYHYKKRVPYQRTVLLSKH